MPSRWSPNSLFQHLVDFFADGVQLPAAAAGDQDEVIEDGRQLPQVEDDDVAAAVQIGDSGGGQGPLETAVLLLAQIGGGTCDSQTCPFLSGCEVAYTLYFTQPPAVKAKSPAAAKPPAASGQSPAGPASPCRPAAAGYW